MTRPTIFAAVLIALAGCSGGGGDSDVPVKAKAIPPAQVEKGKEEYLLPFEVGNTWTYIARTVVQVQNRQTSKEATVTFKVAKVEQIPAGKRVTLELVTNDKVVDRQVWLVNNRGIYQLSIGTTKVRTFSSPIPAILFPVETGKKYSWSGNDGKTEMTYNFTVVGPQEVDTEEKRLSGIAIESKGTSKSGKINEKTERTIWFAPGVGIVRIRESTLSNVGASELLLSLKSHRVK